MDPRFRGGDGIGGRWMGIYDEVMRFRAALRAENDAALGRLVNSYGRIWRTLEGKVRALEADIAEELAAGRSVGTDWLRRQERYRELMAQLQQEVGRYASLLEGELAAAMESAFAAAERDALALTAARLPGIPQAALKSVWNMLPRDAVETLLGFLAEDSPLMKKMAEMGTETALRAARAMEESITVGYSPRALAQTLRHETGMTLTSAMRTARTTQINAYREASRAAYVANQRIVPSWTWVSALDPQGTCMACVARHGSVHPVSERLNDHHNGWCVAVPNPVSYQELGLNVAGPPVEAIPAGADWFAGLPEGQQRQFLRSGSAWEAYKSGKIAVQDFVGSRVDDVWGEIIQEMSVKGLLGG